MVGFHQENSLAVLFLNKVLHKAYDILGGMKGNFIQEALHIVNNHTSEDLKERRDLSILSKDVFSTLENSLGKEIVINIYQDTYYQLSGQYRLLEGFSYLINMVP